MSLLEFGFTKSKAIQSQKKLDSPLSKMPLKADDIASADAAYKNTLSSSFLNEPNASGPDSPKKSDLMLPLHRIKLIMKSCPDVDSVPQDPLHLVAKAAEMFVIEFTKECLQNANSSSHLDYEAVSTLVHSVDRLEFLQETIPRKITWKECQERMKAKDKSKKNSL